MKKPDELLSEIKALDAEHPQVFQKIYSEYVKQVSWKFFSPNDIPDDKMFFDASWPYSPLFIP
ncbi:hypothetical protein [Lentibacillus salinarum]|uniref:hypothetical protein n=1 Tax=Lentibacillus salinarum TaxID=446820 RepID=UPI0036D2935B